MHRLVSILLLTFLLGLSWASNGCVELDKLSFDRIVKRFRYTLVKFDVAFPYGEKHEAFINFALESNEALGKNGRFNFFYGANSKLTIVQF